MTLVTMESSGHYWMPLALTPAPAGHPGRRGQPARGEVLCQEPARPDEVRPGRCPEPRRDGHARHARRPRPARRRRAAPGGPLRDDPRRPSRRKVCQRLIRLVELGFPELGELFDDPTCRTAREVLRIAPTARAATRRRTSTLANANAGPGHRRLGQAKAERLQAAAADSIAVPELDAEVAFEVGLLLDQYDLLERQIEDADRRVAGAPRRRDRPPAPDDPGRRALDRGDPPRRDRRHRALRRLRPAPRVCRRPSRRAELGQEGRRTPRPPGT